MPIGNANIHIQIDVTEYINKRVSFLFCEFNRVREKYYFRTFIFSNSQIEIQVSFSMSTNVNVNMFFLIVILKKYLVLMCLASHFDIIET